MKKFGAVVGIPYCDLLPGDMVFDAERNIALLIVARYKNKVTFMSLWGCVWEGVRSYDFTVNSQLYENYVIFRGNID